VHRAEKTRERIAGIETRRDSNVPGHAFREGMLALVQPASIEREAEAFNTSSESWRWRDTLNLPVNGMGARSACTSMAW